MDFESLLNDYNFSKGKHTKEQNAFCAMEAYSHVRGFEHSDHAPDVDETIQGVIRSWNDSLPSDDERNRLLKPLLPLLRNTKGSDRLSLRRVFMMQDWEIRVRAPAFLHLVPSLTQYAQQLENLPEIKNLSDLKKIESICSAARSAAYWAADSAARSAADSAADSDYDKLFFTTVNHCQTTLTQTIKNMCSLTEADVESDWTWN